MQARVLRIKGSRDKVDRGAEHFVQNIAPRVKQLDGYSGLRLLVNRDTGDAMVVGFWRDAETLRSSWEAMSSVRGDAFAEFGASAPEPEHFEAAVQHRPRPTEVGNAVRISTLQGDPAKVDDGIRHFETQVIPEFERIDGFRGAILLVNRDSGAAIGATVWDSKDHLERSASAATGIRERAAQVMGASGAQAEAYEVHFAELPTPVGAS